MLTSLDYHSPSLTRPGIAGAYGPRQATSSFSGRNSILDMLPSHALVELWPFLEFVQLKRRQILHERNIPLTHAYFIEEGAASLLARVQGRGFLEVGLLGCSDFVGLPLLLGSGRTPHRCVMQSAGSAFRISADDLSQAMKVIPELGRLLMGYAHATMVETAQLAVCNSCHPLKQRLARCLLTIRDRMPGNEIPLTHQVLSRTLGVRRAGVTTAMGRMEEAGLLHRGRGYVLVADRAGLEAEACECYRTIRSEYQRFACTAEESRKALDDQTRTPMLLAS